MRSIVRVSRIRHFSSMTKEIERKFYPDPDLMLKFQSMAHSRVATVFVDQYFDTEDYKLSKDDFWLRARNNKIELNQPFQDKASKIVDKIVGIDYYNENTEWNLILDRVSEKTGISFPKPYPSNYSERYLTDNKVKRFSNIKTYRTRYMIELDVGGDRGKIDINVDHDKVVFLSIDDDTKEKVLGNYEIGEIELQNVESTLSSSTYSGDEKMKTVLDVFGISVDATIRGKMLEYLYQHRTPHYKALESSGLISRKLGIKTYSSQVYELLHKTAVNIFYLRKCNYSCTLTIMRYDEFLYLSILILLTTDLFLSITFCVIIEMLGKFCFHTAKESRPTHMSLPHLRQLIDELGNAGVEKINFAGGQ